MYLDKKNIYFIRTLQQSKSSNYHGRAEGLTCNKYLSNEFNNTVVIYPEVHPDTNLFKT